MCTNPNQAAWIKQNCANYCGVCPPVTQPKPTLPQTQPPQSKSIVDLHTLYTHSHYRTLHLRYLTQYINTLPHTTHTLPRTQPPQRKSKIYTLAHTTHTLPETQPPQSKSTVDLHTLYTHSNY